MTFRHLGILGSLTAALLVLAVAPACAFDDLSDYLEEANEAVYSGQRLMKTNWDGIEATGVMEVEHDGGLAMVSSGHSYTMVGRGKVRSAGSEGVAIEHSSQLEISHGYVLTGGERDVWGGRTVKVIDVLENDQLRMRMVVDTETAAPLKTEVYDGSGNLFRSSMMVEFSDSAPRMADYEDDGDYAMMLPLDEAKLPGRIGDYRLVDAYAGPGDAEQGFYSDGLFRHSLFLIAREADLGGIAPNGKTWVVDGFEYRRVVGPAEVWVLWNAAGATYALVGDLPPDHLEAVLAELPRPSQRNWFSRVWHKLFG